MLQGQSLSLGEWRVIKGRMGSHQVSDSPSSWPSRCKHPDGAFPRDAQLKGRQKDFETLALSRFLSFPGTDLGASKSWFAVGSSCSPCSIQGSHTKHLHRVCRPAASGCSRLRDSCCGVRNLSRGSPDFVRVEGEKR